MSLHDISAAKQALPLRELMFRLGDGDRAKDKSKCPFHDDAHDSFSTFQSDYGQWLFKCHAGCGAGAGDEVNYVMLKFGLPVKEAIQKYCAMAGTNGAGAGHSEATSTGKVHVNTFSWAKCVRDVTEKDINDIADWRGYDLAFVQWMKFKELLGVFKGFPAFAVKNAIGDIIGCHYRIEDGSWRFGPAAGIKTSPLVIGDLETATEAHVHEGAWDLFAEIERMGWHFDGFKEGLVLVATRGAGNAKTLAGMIPKGARVVIWPQNDKVKESDKDTPAQKWTRDLKAIIDQEVTIANIPEAFKDLNDWTRAGATPAMLNEVMESARLIDSSAESGLPPVMAWIDVQFVADNDPSVMIGPGRWAGRGNGVLVVAPTGAGKSTLTATWSFEWALGRPSLGFVPKRRLKSLVVQSEDDAGDLYAMMAGIVEALNPTDEERQVLRENVIIVTERIRMGDKFLKEVVRPLLKAHRPDILWINPLSAFFGGDLNRQQEVAAFFRTGLNPLLAEFGCAVFVVHHTAKPSKDRAGWDKSDLNYLGAGSADLANWARETILLREVGDGLFELVCSKRWRHLGWTDADGKPCRERLIVQGTGGRQFWRLADNADVERSGRVQFTEAALLAMIPDEGIDKAELIDKAALTFAMTTKAIGSHVLALSKRIPRTICGHKGPAALVSKTERPRREVYPDGPPGRPVVWLTKIAHFQDVLHNEGNPQP